MGKQRSKWLYDVLFGYRLLKNASKVIALTPFEAQQYIDFGVPEEKIQIIPNGIDLSQYDNLLPNGSFKKKFDITEEMKIVLYLGRIHKIKGLDILVRAFANIVKELDDVKLVIIGPDDGYLRELETLIRLLEIPNNVQIVGYLSGKDKLAAGTVDADVYVLPSRYEIFGITVLESVACGTPIIITDVCGLADYFGDQVRYGC